MKLKTVIFILLFITYADAEELLNNEVLYEQIKDSEHIIDQPRAQLFELGQQNHSPIQLPYESSCLTIHQIHFSGKKQFPLLTEKKLQQWSDILIGKCLGNEGIDIYLSYIEQQLSTIGYVTSQVLIPQQNLLFGILTIQLVPGIISKIIYHDTQQEHYSLNNAFVYDKKSPLNLRALEQGLDNLQNAPLTEPTIHVNQDPDAAQSSIIVIQRHKQRGLYGRITFDGRKLPGKADYLINNILLLSNPLLLNDSLYLSLDRDADNDHSKGLKNAYFSYSIPYKYGLFTAMGSYQDTYNDAGLTFSDGRSVRYAQRSKYISIESSYLLHRDFNTKTSLVIGTQLHTLNTFLAGIRLDNTEKRLASYAVVGLNHQWFLPRGQADFSVRYKQATDWFGAKLIHDLELKKAQIYQFSADISQYFFLFSQPFLYHSAVEIQLAHSLLDGKLDKTSLAGRNGLKGFTYATTRSGSQALEIKQQLSWLAPFPKGQLYWGIDYGAISEDRGYFWRDNRLLGTEIGVKGQFKAINYQAFIGAPLWKPAQTRADPLITGFIIGISY